MLIGTPENPLRPSSLDRMIQCPFRYVAQIMNITQDTSGTAADTGSAVHAGVARYHLDKDLEAGLRALRESLSQFPKASQSEAELIYSHYTSDPRNQITCEIIERQVEVTIPCHESDVTQLPITIRGTLDQIRVRNGVMEVWDLKTGQTYDGFTQLNSYAMQQAAYVLAARNTLKADVRPGGLICTKGYRTRGAELPSPGGVFWYSPLSVRQCELLLESVAFIVAAIRSGELLPFPGQHCNFCPLQGPDGCTSNILQLI